MSSRNVRLDPAQRIAATVLHRALLAALAALKKGEREASALRTEMATLVKEEPLARLDYVSVADPLELRELRHVEGPALLSLAVHFGAVRLIDNVLWPPPYHLTQ
jgi:pantoate--beta-alanine ligase